MKIIKFRSLAKDVIQTEIDALQGAVDITDRVFDLILPEIKAGVTEKHIAARISYLFKEEGGDGDSYDPIIASGANGALPHATPSDKKIENSRLETDKKRRKKYLNKVNNQKSTLENNLKQKQRMITEIESIINTLFNDKASMKKREDELARIRSMQNRATSGNFTKMKGKLSWPVQGKIISRFGNQKNQKLKTITENVGIEIQAAVGTPVITVLDGVISTITYIRGHGNIIIIDHGGGFSTVYAQVDEIIVNENE